MTVERRHLTVNGIVQGVGFRPFVHHLAHQLDLSGWVCNSPAGVEIELQGETQRMNQFVSHLQNDAPPLAHILSIETRQMGSFSEEPATLRILPSLEANTAGLAQPRTLISPDVATCKSCLQELGDPADRRYQYPFTNCTHCGPRFTIINGLPYDRPLTTMADFPLCLDCAREYHDPQDRRFHAQPVCCAACGPEIWFIETGNLPGNRPRQSTTDALQKAAEFIHQGRIIAIKGLGGFHLACRADDAAAVQRLRAAKSRPDKPLAVMVTDIAMARQFCQVNQAEADWLSSPAAPVVLLRKARPGANHLGDWVAPNNDALGVMLPYTPLHHLFMQAVRTPIILTSGNRPGQPLCIDNQVATVELGPLADGFLFHNRPITRRCDDSVVMVLPNPDNTHPGRRHAQNGATRPETIGQPIRRSRGYTPLPILLPRETPLAVPLVATGADLKNVSAVAIDRHVFLTQYIGNLHSPQVRHFQQQALADFERLFQIQPQAIVCDLHPDYAGSRYARRRSREEGLSLLEVQHHHAHLAGCLAEHDVPGRALGFCFDGAGYGPDERIWGGEVLLTDLAQYERLYHLEYLPLPGGDAAIHRPYRTAIAYLLARCPELNIGALFPDVSATEMDVLEKMVEQQINTPLTSSMGRLFDAVSAILGVCHETTYEAQAAIALEAAACKGTATGRYPFDVVGDQIQVGQLLGQVAAGRLQGRPVAGIARRFHQTIAGMVVALAQAARAGGHWLPQGEGWPVALSGGVWQNRLLLEMTIPLLQQAEFTVLLHRQVPANDGGIAYGQAAVAAARLKGA